MSKIKEVSTYLESIAPLSLQEGYDNAGLIVGNENEDITGVLVSLDCTEAVVEEAIKNKCNLIVSHHPIVFSGLKKLNGKNYVERTVIYAIKNNIAIYAIHTNLDNVKEGVNKMICDKLGLKNTRILSPKKNILRKLVTFCPKDKSGQIRSALFEAGAGKIGHYDECSFNTDGTGTFRGSDSTNPFVGEKGKQHHEAEVRIETIFPAFIENDVVSKLIEAHPYEEVAYDIYPIENTHQYIGSGMIGELETEMDEQDFLNHLKIKMNSGGIRHTSLIGKKVKRIAVCGGSGSFLLNDAIRAGAQFFVTADFKYHQFFDADGKIVIVDIGHYESEQFTPELIKGFLMKYFSTFATRLSEVVTNPVHYY